MINRSLEILSINKYTELDYLFDNQPEGWIGSDVCHSIDLKNNRILFLFGDTIIGKTHKNERSKDFKMINNAIGLMNSSRKEPKKMDFFWEIEKEPKSFFKQPKKMIGDFIWPTNGIVLKDGLYIFCMAVNSTPDFSIDIDGTIVVRIQNYFENPNDWDIEYWDFEFNKGIIHSSVYPQKDWLYFFGAKKNVFENNMVIARMKLKDLSNHASSKSLKFYIGGGYWSNNFNRAKPMFYPGNSESNIYYCKKNNNFITTTYVPKNNKIYLLWSKKLTGPWSEPQCIYTVPEAKQDFKVVSYAIRIHTWASDVTESLIISYATNEYGGMDNLFTKEGYNIYRPYFIQVRI